MVVASHPSCTPAAIPKLVEESIRTLLHAGRERAMLLSLRVERTTATTTVRAIHEDEILQRSMDTATLGLLKRAEDVRRVRVACDQARQFYFQSVATRAKTTKGQTPVEERPSLHEKKSARHRRSYRRKGKMARVGLPVDPYREYKIQGVKALLELINWIP